MKSRALISRSNEILGGTPVFAGTRVPVQTLIDYLEAGDRLDDFLKDFPTVSRKQATSVSRHVASPASSRRRSLIRRALHQDDLARVRRRTPAEKLKTALELSELCFRLKKAVQTAGSGHGKS